MSTIQTYDPHSLTSIGWRIQMGPKRAVMTRRSRWQGSRDGLRITVQGDLRDLIPQEIEDDPSGIEIEVDRAVEDAGSAARGTRLRMWGYPARITDAGYEVG